MKKHIIFCLYVLIAFFIFSCDNNTSPTEPEEIIENDYDVMLKGEIVATTGLGMGVDDSRQLRNWVEQDSTYMRMNYPGGLGWGAVFITVGGDPQDPPRPWIDISKCTKLSIEMKGVIGDESVKIGMKDKDDPDDGTETKKVVYLTQNWEIYEFMLSDFITCDLTKVYVVTEFVFPGASSNKAVTVDIKNVSILK